MEKLSKEEQASIAMGRFTNSNVVNELLEEIRSQDERIDGLKDDVEHKADSKDVSNGLFMIQTRISNEMNNITEAIRKIVIVFFFTLLASSIILSYRIHCLEVQVGVLEDLYATEVAEDGSKD